MGKKTVTLLVIATSLIVVGCLLFGGVMMALGWDFSKLSTEKYETNTHEITVAVNKIDIKTNTANTEFFPADDGVCKVVCYEADNEKHSVTVENGCLTIRVTSEKKWYDYIGIQFASPKITVYLPRGVYESLAIHIRTGHVAIPADFQFKTVDISGNTGHVAVLSSVSEALNVETNTGDITVGDATVGSMNLKVSTGRITISNVKCAGDANLEVSTGKAIITDLTCKNLTTSGNTGDLSLDHVVATEKMTIRRSTGDVKFNACDAAEILVKTDTGNVTGTLCSEKVFLCQTDTGRVEVPKTTIGGKCEVITDTGDIRLNIEG